ncbi:MAG: uroporphyrinogen-III C-methyltransferase [Candidatus Lambdaproteobacteria bacterium]|nr:uroporphyrinogen-III C-methyltransferase [Candidatus Lambdaproteobacteria bacterium]
MAGGERESGGFGVTGRVSIVGAGPGDAELMTLKALRLVQAADAIVHDALVSEEIKACFPARCQVFDVGKRAGDAASTPQAEINALLVRLARQGLHVVRLKGGDPFVFGRGGEEALHLAERRIPFEIVPGVSAMSAAAAGAGIPLTHRGLSNACTALNGFGPYLERIRWDALVGQGGTWVFYMAKRSVEAIVARLLAHGADPALGVAVVESASLPGQAVHARRLGEVARNPLPPLGAGPALVIVGPSVALLEDLNPMAGGLHADVRAVSGLSEAAR